MLFMLLFIPQNEREYVLIKIWQKTFVHSRKQNRFLRGQFLGKAIQKAASFLPLTFRHDDKKGDSTVAPVLCNTVLSCVVL